MAIYDLLKTILVAMDKKIPICAIFMDMSKAFDRVDHTILMQKLSMYGIRGKAQDLIFSYLDNRKQIVEITQICQKSRNEIKHKSKSKTIKIGVPQGSVLGPLLFLIYINDLPKHISQPMVLFADESTVIIKSDKENDYEHVVNQTLNTIIQWLTENNLKINMDKTKIIHFHQRTQLTNINVSYQGEIVHPVTDTKFLGINIDNKLTWKTHLDYICKRINKSSFALYKLSKIVNKEALLAAYHGFVAPVLRYGIISWGNSVDKESVFKAQKKCVRSMCNIDNTTSCHPYFQSLNILTLPSIYIYELNVFVKLNPNYYKSAFKSYYRQLRDKKRLEIDIPYGKTALINKSILCMASLIYNKLPDEVKKLPVHQFKSKLHKFLVNKCYYNVKEYLQDKNIYL